MGGHRPRDGDCCLFDEPALWKAFLCLTGRPASVAELLGKFPWQTDANFLLLALMAWSRNMRVQLFGIVASLILVNSSMTDRGFEVAKAG